MISYFARRLVYLLITALVTSILIFSITQLLPGDVARVILGREAGEAALEDLRQELGLNQPAYMQYFDWLSRFVQGDWGRSFSTRSDVFPVVMERMGNSLYLAGFTLALSVPLAIILGVIAGLRENSFLDGLISISSLAFVGLPEFVTGLVLIQVFALDLRLLPASSTLPTDATFLEMLPSLILPAVTATLVLLAYITRLTRAEVIEEVKKPYVRTARLKGLPRSTVIFKHILRNALLPTITVIAISFGWLISGLIVIENVFNYPGLGRLLVFAINRRDLPIVQAVAMITVFSFALANLIADLLYGALNPRIRLE
jgi:peptide/nickel transport system permease protein